MYKSHFRERLSIVELFHPRSGGEGPGNEDGTEQKRLFEQICIEFDT